MHIETERKFLVKDDSYKSSAVAAHKMTQGYIAKGHGRTVRVRIADDKAWLTIKGASIDGISRLEWEKEIELAEAEDLLELCQDSFVSKIRHIVPFGGKIFEVDEFLGDNAGLVMAEIELDSPDEAFLKPDWLGEEVTGDRRYYNTWLSAHPFTAW